MKNMAYKDLPVCRTCGRKLRTTHQKAAEYTEPTMRGWDGFCETHHEIPVFKYLPKSNKHDPTPEADKAWFEAYVADRRSRGIPQHGEFMAGEEPVVVPAKPILPHIPPRNDVCKNGHPRTPANTTYYVSPITGDRFERCLECKRAISARQYAARKAAMDAKQLGGHNLPTHCGHGHEYTPENTVLSGVSKYGHQIRRCRICEENRIMRRTTITRAANPSKKTHCPHGHEFTPENTHVNLKGFRVCIECRNGKRRASRLQRQADTKVQDGK